MPDNRRQRRIRQTPAESNIDALSGELFAQVCARSNGVSPSELEKSALSRCGAGRSDVRNAIRHLVAEGLLTYSEHFGSTRLERSFDKASRISKRVWLFAPGRPAPDLPGAIGIMVEPGAAFGDGRHPTTRLAVDGIEYVLKETPEWSDAGHAPMMLDIGTGTGVLAIAALKMGVKRAVGTDIDACACFSARQNAKLNGVKDRFDVTSLPLESIPGAFDLIAANLRAPTLHRIAGRIAECAVDNGNLVISGIHAEEISEILDAYRRFGFEMRRRRCEGNWAALVLMKTRPLAVRHDSG